jgi:hypothetical protein
MQLCGLCGDTPSWCATSITRSPDCTASTAQYRSSTLDRRTGEETAADLLAALDLALAQLPAPLL